MIAIPNTGSRSVRTIVEDRLAGDDALPSEAARLVRAAFAGQLDEALADEAVGASFDAPAPEDAEPAGAWLTGVAIQGFRGIGPRAELALPPGPGLTLAVGRNGTGKSSFAEGLELALTGRNSRWEDMSSTWTEGWRNLHHEGPVSVEARFAVDGIAGEALVSLRWPNADFDDRVCEGLDTLGWEDAITDHRPLLSHSQLSRRLEGKPSDLFSAMSVGLGMEEISETRERLRQRRLQAERMRRDAEKAAGALRSDLVALEDDRASCCANALERDPWDLEAIEGVLTDATSGEGGQSLNILRALATSDAPAPKAIQDVSEQIVKAHERLTAIASSDTARADRLLKMLTEALALHEHDGDQPCPVCGEGTIDAVWAGEARERQMRLRREAREARAAQKARSDALDAARQLCAPAPKALSQAEGVGIDASAAINAWRDWTEAPDGEPDLPELVKRLAERGAALQDAVANLRTSARDELDRLQALWQPLRQRLADWLPQGREARRAVESLPGIRAAESWVKAVEEDVRAERFRPVAERTRRFWEMMRQSSSVSLEKIALMGTAKQRHLDIAVTIDGEGSVALGVMSQGELNTLSLSLFLARATLPESPFRFLVIDDPVQAMDPARVDGLANVLEEVAVERQVIVFTHDTRLRNAVRQLQIDAQIIEVARSLNSLVAAQQVDGPVWRNLEDARAILRAEQVHESTKARIIPVFCRQALEAACIEALWRTRATSDIDREQTEEDIRKAQMLTDKLELLLLGATEHGGDLLETVKQKFGEAAADVVMDCNRGAHGGALSMPLNTLLNRTGSLADKLRKMR